MGEDRVDWERRERVIRVAHLLHQADAIDHKVRLCDGERGQETVRVLDVNTGDEPLLECVRKQSCRTCGANCSRNAKFGLGSKLPQHDMAKHACRPHNEDSRWCTHQMRAPGVWIGRDSVLVSSRKRASNRSAST